MYELMVLWQDTVTGSLYQATGAFIILGVILLLLRFVGVIDV